MKNKVVGYERVSKSDMELDNQEHLIKAFAHDNKMNITEWFKVELSSRKSQEDRRITELKELLVKDDILIVTDLDRLGRDMADLVSLIAYFQKKGVLVYFVTDTMLNPSGDELMDQLKVSIVAFFAQVERRRISRRTKSSLQVLKSKGVKLGHKKKFLKSKYDEFEEAIYAYRDKHISYNKICSLLDPRGTKEFKMQSLRTWFQKRYDLDPMFNTLQKLPEYQKHLDNLG